MREVQGKEKGLHAVGILNFKELERGTQVGVRTRYHSRNNCRRLLNPREDCVASVISNCIVFFFCLSSSLKIYIHINFFTLSTPYFNLLELLLRQCQLRTDNLGVYQCLSLPHLLAAANFI